MRDERPSILGGDTPFFAASDAPFLYPPGFDHQPFTVAIEGKDQTRNVKCFLLAGMQNLARLKGYPNDSAGLKQFMREATAGANTDLRALGIGPLISLAEVDAWEKECVERGTLGADVWRAMDERGAP